jgi:hypothetical protein
MIFRAIAEWRSAMRRDPVDRCLRDPVIREKYAGKILALGRQKIWGVGDDAESASRNARSNASCPPVEDLVLVAIPSREEVEQAAVPEKLALTTLRSGSGTPR